MHEKGNLSPETLIWMYTQMVRIREFEERVKRSFVENPGVIRGHTHLADGGEATIVGALATRNADDLALATYRCHGYPLVLGTSPRKMMAEIYGRTEGLCKGFGGSMHLVDPEHHFAGTSGIVGQGIAQATGAALTAQVKKTGQVIFCFFGDGATKQGVFFESLNVAALWKLPIVYLLENNGYQAYTHNSLEDANAAAGDPLSRKAEAFSMPGVTLDGTDVLAVYEGVGKAVQRARSGLGPTLLELNFYRFSAHGNTIVVPPLQPEFPEHEALGIYGNKAEYDEARARDPIHRFYDDLKNTNVITDADALSIAAAARREMDDAVQFALASPLPAPEEAVKYVYA